MEPGGVCGNSCGSMHFCSERLTAMHVAGLSVIALILVKNMFQVVCEAKMYYFSKNVHEESKTEE